MKNIGKKFFLGKNSKYVSNEQILIDLTPSNVINWVISNAQINLNKISYPHLKTAPRYSRKRKLSKFCLRGALLCLFICMLTSIILISDADKNIYGKIFLFGFVLLIIFLLLSAIIRIDKLEPYFSKGAMEIETYILSDGRVAVVQYISDKNWKPSNQLKCTGANHITSCVNYVYVDIINSISEIELDSDGYCVKWNGEKYYVLRSDGAQNNTNVPRFYTLYKYDVNNAEGIFPFIYEENVLLKDTVQHLLMSN